MGVYRSICRTCGDELVTASVTDARQYTRSHFERGHEARVCRYPGGLLEADDVEG